MQDISNTRSNFSENHPRFRIPRPHFAGKCPPGTRGSEHGSEIGKKRICERKILRERNIQNSSFLFLFFFFFFLFPPRPHEKLKISRKAPPYFIILFFPQGFVNSTDLQNVHLPPRVVLFLRRKLISSLD